MTRRPFYRPDGMPITTPKAYKYTTSVHVGTISAIKQELVGHRFGGHLHLERKLECKIHEKFFDSYTRISFKRRRDLVNFMLKYL